jgi:endonuclease/exonuclease/phosphatase family metal-dependent hydrolase
MDDATFDPSATDPVVETSRRRLLGGLAGGTLAGVFGLRETEADRKRHDKHDNKSQKGRREQGSESRRDQGDTRRGEGKSKGEEGKQVGSASALSEGQSKERDNSQALTVLTRNLYLGADLDRIFTAQTPQELVLAVGQVFAMVQATNFPERAKALAGEIAALDPQIVGLQEVTLWRSGPADSIPLNAKTIEYDFLKILLKELAGRGKSYDAVARVQNADAEAPGLTSTGLKDFRITDHEVILARTDLPKKVFSVDNIQSGNFVATKKSSNILLGPIPIPCGWVAVDARLQGETIRVVSTHLERSDPVTQVAQGQELLTSPLNTTLPTVLLGDLNSDANGGGTLGESDTATYGNMLVQGGFVDAWTTAGGNDGGSTWGHAENLLNPTPSLTERIDFVLTRGGITAASANRVGHELKDRTPSGLWPSDHAGVWAVLQLQDA